MRRLFTWMMLVVVLSQFPQVSKEFKKEREGVQAAYQKAEKTYCAVSTAYDKTQSDIKKVQKSLTELKGNIDKGVARANKTSAEASKYCESLKTLSSGSASNKEKQLKNNGGATQGTNNK